MRNLTVMTFLAVSFLAGLVVCPFPASHPYSFLNPVIDPWWAKLDKDTQKQVYSLWENHEPSLFALGKTMSNFVATFCVAKLVHVHLDMSSYCS